VHLRVLRPADGVYAFYDGRIEGYRFSPERNWVDEGALALGVASYALLSGEHALVCDTHTTVGHARRVREALEDEGARHFTVVLSHWHLDHVAGTEVFGDCEVISSDRTAAHLAARREAIEAGELEGPPPIDPLVLPTRTYEDRMTLGIGDLSAELIHVDIHSDDATVVWLPGRRLLLCGDAMEDTVTYVDEPQSFDAHLADLDRLRELGPERILPSHGDPEVIAGGGYPPGLIDATQRYIRTLQRVGDEPALREPPLRELVADSIEAGWVNYFPPYEEVHRENLATVLGGSAT
jgi:cyclase